MTSVALLSPKGVLQGDMGKLGLSCHILGPNLRILQKLQAAKLEGVKMLLARCIDRAERVYSFDHTKLLPLDLPSAAELNLIDYDQLFACNEAMRKVMDACVYPLGLNNRVRSAIDLRQLPTIYKKFLVTTP